MARKPRIHIPGALYHVMLRGNNKQSIFAADGDRCKFEQILSDGVPRFGHAIHAYCWMGNHIHMAIRIAETPLARVMHNLSFRYTQYFNWQHNRVGHLFQGRYKSVLVDADCYLLQLIRYIHRNPVRAQLCSQLDDYLWSSHRAYLGLLTLDWLDTSWVLSQFSNDMHTATEQYAEFVGTSLVPVEDPDFKRGSGKRAIAGDELFQQRVMLPLPLRPDARGNNLPGIFAAVCMASGISEPILRSGRGSRSTAAARNAVIYLATSRRAATLTVLGLDLKRDASTISRIVQQMQFASCDCPSKMLAARAEAILRNARMQASYIEVAEIPAEYEAESLVGRSDIGQA